MINQGNSVISLKYDDNGSFSEGLALVKLKGKLGFIDKTGKLIIPLKYDAAFAFENDLAKGFPKRQARFY